MTIAIENYPFSRVNLRVQLIQLFFELLSWQEDQYKTHMQAHFPLQHMGCASIVVTCCC